MAADERDRLLGVIEARCLAGVNGSTWQVETVRELEERGNLNREAALREMFSRYLENMHTNRPVHEWA